MKQCNPIVTVSCVPFPYTMALPRLIELLQYLHDNPVCVWCIFHGFGWLAWKLENSLLSLSFSLSSSRELTNDIVLHQSCRSWPVAIQWGLSIFQVIFLLSFFLSLSRSLSSFFSFSGRFIFFSQFRALPLGSISCELSPSKTASLFLSIPYSPFFVLSLIPSLSLSFFRRFFFHVLIFLTFDPFPTAAETIYINWARLSDAAIPAAPENLL